MANGLENKGGNNSNSNWLSFIGFIGLIMLMSWRLGFCSSFRKSEFIKRPTATKGQKEVSR